jgi:hypothetical protein
MVTVGHESSAVNLFAHPNAENRHQFIASKANDGGYRHRPQMLDRLGAQQTIHRLIARHNCAE